MGTSIHPLVAAAEAVRLGEKLSGEQFARKVGMSGSSWSRLAAGKQGLGLGTLKAILRAYPGLVSYVLPSAGGVGEVGVPADMRGPPPPA